MDNRNFLIAFLFLLMPGIGFAQSNSYNLDIYPDVWYNSVDGVRVGGFVLGEMEGEFQSGPHRLNAGFWLGTNFPDLPVSYYLSFTEPIPKFTSYGNEANIRLKSSIRTGYSQHEFSLNKRWQPGFSELVFRELSLSFSREKLIDAEYRPYPLLWQNDWKSLLGANFWMSNVFEFGKFDLKASLKHNLANSANYTIGTLEIKQQISLGNKFELRLRGFFGLTNEDAAPEYLFGISYGQPIGWLNKRFSRAKGTLPGSLLDEGLFHISGSTNLRGYTISEFSSLKNGTPIQYNFANALNMEFKFPNPLNSAIEKSMVGNFLRFQSYIFADAGTFFRNNFQQTPDLITDVNELKADAGIGLQFSFNIPDYLGKNRGFALRYEVPLWLSGPEAGENKFKFRNLIGIGAVISL